jgi:peptidoglycan/LPS O-acetylase OafA/YrhL
MSNTSAVAPAQAVSAANLYTRVMQLFFRFETGSGLRLTALDGLRGIAATLVVLAHTYDEPLPGVTPPPRIVGLHQFLRTAGTGGVMLFFVLSGFLLYLPWARSHVEGTGAPTWKVYAARRCLRIMPAYYFIVLVLAFAPTFHGAPYVGTGRLFMHFIFLPSLTTRYPALLGVFWTLQVEEFYYWSLPFLHRIFRRSLTFGLVTSLIVAAGYALLVLIVMPSRSWVGALNQTPFHLATFASGMGGAVLYARWRRAQKPLPTTMLLVLALVCYGAAAWFATWVVEAHPTLQAAASVAFLPGCGIAVFAAATGGAQRFLTTTPLRFLGAISYSLYLWHLVFVRLVPMPSAVLPHLTTRILWVLFVAIVVSSISFLLVERPFLKLRPRPTAK